MVLLLLTAAFRFILIFTYTESAADILNIYPQMWSDANREITTCDNRCGEEEPICSCKSRCRVYKNCCQDFKDVCPQEYYDSENIIHVLNRSVTCHEQNAVWMVDSCHGHRDTDVSIDTTPRTGLETTSTRWWYGIFSSTHRSLIQIDIKQQYDNLHSIIEGRPVVDLFNGIIFKNWTIFSCNSVNQSNPVFWNINLGISREGSEFQNFTDFVKSLSGTSQTLYVVPPSINETSTISYCHPLAIGHCSSDTTDPVTRAKCRSLITYVAANSTPTGALTLYTNIHCLKCSGVENNSSFRLYNAAPYFHTRWNDFRLVMSFSNEGIVLKPLRVTSWSERLCPYTPRLDPILDSDSCEITQCAIGTVKTADGKCLYSRRLQLSFHHETSGQLRDKQHEALPAVYTCVLQELGDSFGMKVTGEREENIQTSPIYEDNLGLNLTAFEIDVLIENEKGFTDPQLTGLMDVLNIASSSLASQTYAGTDSTAAGERAWKGNDNGAFNKPPITKCIKSPVKTRGEPSTTLCACFLDLPSEVRPSGGCIQCCWKLPRTAIYSRAPPKIVSQCQRSHSSASEKVNSTTLFLFVLQTAVIIMSTYKL